MDRHAFLMSLEKELKKRKIDDVSDIIDEYNDYIIHQLELGKKRRTS